MTYIIPPGFSRLTFEYDAVSVAGSKPVWGVGLSAAPSSDLLVIVRDWLVDFFLPRTSSDALMTRTVMRNDVEVVEDNFSLVGGASGQHGAPNTAALITLASGLVGRQNRGRIYWPFVIPETEIDGGGTISSTRVQVLNTAFGELMSALVAEGANPVILHSTSSDPTPVSSWQVQAIAATQRRRLRA